MVSTVEQAVVSDSVKSTACYTVIVWCALY